MKNAVKFTAALSGVSLILFAGGIFYLLRLAQLDSKTQSLYSVFVFLFAVLVLTAAAVFVYSVISMSLHSRNHLRTDIAKAVLLSEANAAVKEFSLLNMDSALIGMGVSAYIDLNEALSGGLASREYAVINRIGKDWFVESVSDGDGIGLKRAGDQRIYKLKTGVCYKLCVYDILYIEKERLLFLSSHLASP